MVALEVTTALCGGAAGREPTYLFNNNDKTKSLTRLKLKPEVVISTKNWFWVTLLFGSPFTVFLEPQVLIAFSIVIVIFLVTDVYYGVCNTLFTKY